jgi:hypothetical protein
MTATPRVLGCAINRSNSTESQTNVNKLTKNKMAPSFSSMASFESIQISSSETTCDAREQTKKPLEKQREVSSIFRSRPVVEDDDEDSEFDLLMLKRATPVFDEDEESPTKRLRRTAAFDDEDERDDSNQGQEISDVLSWSNLLFEGDDGYSFSSIMLTR